METDELIAVLAADEVAPKRPHLALRVLPGLAISALLVVLVWQIRPDWAGAITHAPVMAKSLLPLALAILAGALLLRPSPDRPLPVTPFVVAAGLAALAWGMSVAAGGDMMGRTALQCIASIPTLALPLGLPLLIGLRHRVEPRPARAGLLAGLFAGAAATVLYALHCNEDAPAFFLLWYSLGIAICAFAGRFAGRRMLGV